MYDLYKEGFMWARGIWTWAVVVVVVVVVILFAWEGSEREVKGESWLFPFPMLSLKMDDRAAVVALIGEKVPF